MSTAKNLIFNLKNLRRSGNPVIPLEAFPVSFSNISPKN
jgi:hypothetical protein